MKRSDVTKSTDIRERLNTCVAHARAETDRHQHDIDAMHEQLYAWRARTKELLPEAFDRVLRLVCAVKMNDTGAGHTGGNGAGAVTYNTMRFRASGRPDIPLVLRGQRDPEIRHQLLDVDFSNKSTLDLGCNAGGMLLARAEVMRQAVGVDFDGGMVKLANSIAAELGWPKQGVAFYQHNLNNVTDFDRLLTYATGGTRWFDVITMFSINMWLQHPSELISWALQHTSTFLIETNGLEATANRSIDVLKRGCLRLVEKTNWNRCNDCFTGRPKPRRLWKCETGRLPPSVRGRAGVKAAPQGTAPSLIRRTRSPRLDMKNHGACANKETWCSTDWGRKLVSKARQECLAVATDNAHEATLAGSCPWQVSQASSRDAQPTGGRRLLSAPQSQARWERAYSTTTDGSQSCGCISRNGEEVTKQMNCRCIQGKPVSASGLPASAAYFVEKLALCRLQRCVRPCGGRTSYFPQLLDWNDTLTMLVMSYEGQPLAIGPFESPMKFDYLKLASIAKKRGLLRPEGQLKCIAKQLEEAGVVHLDLGCKQLVARDGKLTLGDFDSALIDGLPSRILKLMPYHAGRSDHKNRSRLYCWSDGTSSSHRQHTAATVTAHSTQYTTARSTQHSTKHTAHSTQHITQTVSHYGPANITLATHRRHRSLRHQPCRTRARRCMSLRGTATRPVCRSSSSQGPTSIGRIL